jgi:hypothetical protein
MPWPQKQKDGDPGIAPAVGRSRQPGYDGSMAALESWVQAR